MKPTKTHEFRVTVVTEKDIPNIADVVGGRLWGIDGVAPNGVNVTTVDTTLVVDPITDSLVPHAAVGIVDLSRVRDVSYQGYIGNVPNLTIGNGHAGTEPGLVNMDAINEIVSAAVNMKKD